MYRVFTLPININTRLVVNNIAAVDRLAGKMRNTTINTGIIRGTKADLKSLMLSCFFVSVR